MQPETKYAKSGDVHIAYQVVGDGPVDLVIVTGWVSHVDLAWENPIFERATARLASFARVLLFDKRGTGLSDRVQDGALPTLEQRMDDVRAVMDAASSERAVLFGISEGGSMSLMFSATYPDRVSGLILYASYPLRRWAEDYPWGLTDRQCRAVIESVEQSWGRVDENLLRRAPSLGRLDEREQRRMAAYMRASASPSAAIALQEMNWEIDVRDLLPLVRVPTLVLHRTNEQQVDVHNSRYMAERIPHAVLIELPGTDHYAWSGDPTPIIDEVEEFVTGERHAVEADRVLATVLFTDIVGSTERLAELGDRRWRDVLEEHFRLIRRELARHRGREVKTTGDGLLATFDGPARAIRCASAIRDGTRQLGIEIRAGLHTGEVEVLEQDLGGIAIHTGARVVAEAGPGEVLVSSTVRDLVAGSGIGVDDRGVHTLKGIPGEWRLFRVTP
jgi:class 3 adenylate cyclase